MFFLPKILIFTGAFFLFSGSLAHASGPVAAKVELQLVVPEVGALGGEAVTPVPLVLPERAQNGFLDGIVPGVPAKPLLATVLAGADDTGAALPEFHPAPLPMADDDDRLRL
ncbi:MAG: hypothetical protein OEV59_08310, partial [Deltaproteobacteria bacterium]|nr:hypothetical protein [Deltaproteobacteria bacterium]